MIKRFWTMCFMLMLSLLVLAACGESADDATTAVPTEETAAPENPNYPGDVTENPVVTITMENNATITIELDPKAAPNTVANFISLAQQGYYDGLIFHRVIPGFMIQGGDPDGQGTGGPGYSIAGEFTDNGFDNAITHERGVISMARSQSPDSAGSQFFIMVESAPHLDGQYAAFGRVLEGMEAVDAIVSVDRDQADKPNEPQVMRTVTVDTKGYTYPAPIKQ